MSGWMKVMTEEGEIRREGDTLFLISEKGGEKTVDVIKYKLE